MIPPLLGSAGCFMHLPIIKSFRKSVRMKLMVFCKGEVIWNGNSIFGLNALALAIYS